MTVTRINYTSTPKELQLTTSLNSGYSMNSEKYYSLNGAKYFSLAIKHTAALNAGTVYTMGTLPWTTRSVAVASSYGYTVNISSGGAIRVVPTTAQSANGVTYIDGVLI